MGLQCGRFIECFIVPRRVWMHEVPLEICMLCTRTSTLPVPTQWRVMFGVEHIGNLMGKQ